MKWLKFISFFSILLATLAFSGAYLEKLLEYCRKENHKYKFYSIYYLESIQPPTKDLFYKSYYVTQRNNSFFREKQRIPSPILDTVFTVYPNIKEEQTERNYKSLYELLNYLVAVKSNDEEFEVLELYIKNKYKGSEQELNDFIRYLELNFLEPAISKIRKGQFSEAKKDVELCYDRLQLVDTKPLDDNKLYLNRRINRIYLTRALLSNTFECYANYDQISLLIPKIGKQKGAVNELYIDFPVENSDLGSGFVEYINYWKGIHAFRKYDYQAARQYFSSSSQDFDLKDLSLLMIARCTFWANQFERNNLAVYNELQKIQNEVMADNFK